MKISIASSRSDFPSILLHLFRTFVTQLRSFFTIIFALALALSPCASAAPTVVSKAVSGPTPAIVSSHSTNATFFKAYKHGKDKEHEKKKKYEKESPQKDKKIAAKHARVIFRSVLGGPPRTSQRE
ncbi:hypothetical protein K488DRAFT_85950 [Vararia minispora EC-137]|uniref:Uncharacterized protein n=1 Tax=Vararia minispora EC-137 TaxID=1314806 RepID=A0ACB8QKG4_9AGAM|nr:hypothetical protein K488DRAFT_85950 [Vararia minispora EC-137]